MSDSLTMVGRSLRLTMRTPDALLTSLLLPVMLMLLFVYLFGGAIQTGTGTSPTSSRGCCRCPPASAPPPRP
jgi:hypothetical protein